MYPYSGDWPNGYTGYVPSQAAQYVQPIRPQRGWIRATFRYMWKSRDPMFGRVAFIIICSLIGIDTTAMISEFLLTFTGIGALLDLLQITEVPAWFMMVTAVVIRWFIVRARIREYRYK